ncbi:hypothetical protein NDN08_004685 [Rhodosorus marinus]|uniref:3-dehydrosphinganine reductase n=1 Tax=Rhodosorus marinus TaxID=101924 RepID=A0AAV8USJ1_9RHOD|nr:hypothetical protein NDN08_004685 [Rhodosorus marinus]
MEWYYGLLFFVGGWVAFWGFLAIVNGVVRQVRGFTSKKYYGKHVLITGGSEGLGRELAAELVGQGSRVTIASRSEKKLKAAVEYISSICCAESASSLQSFTCDVTKENDVKNLVKFAKESFGPVDHVIACAGTALTGRFGERSMEDHRKSMDLNYFGALHAVYALVPDMMSRRSGSICLVSSGAALTSYIGYGAYSPSKYALRGLAEVLRNELKPYNIDVHIAYPANIESPGFAVEQLTKPEEAKAIEAGETHQPPEKVAKLMLHGLKMGDYNNYCGALEVGILGVFATGLTPRSNVFKDLLLYPLLFPIAFGTRTYWDWEVCRQRYRSETNS